MRDWRLGLVLVHLSSSPAVNLSGFTDRAKGRGSSGRGGEAEDIAMTATALPTRSAPLWPDGGTLLDRFAAAPGQLDFIAPLLVIYEVGVLTLAAQCRSQRRRCLAAATARPGGVQPILSLAGIRPSASSGLALPDAASLAAFRKRLLRHDRRMRRVVDLPAAALATARSLVANRGRGNVAERLRRAGLDDRLPRRGRV